MKTITIDGIEYKLTPITTEAPKPVQWEARRLHTLNNYYSFDTDMKVFSTPETQHLLDMARADFGNYFYSQQEAEEAAKQVRQLLRLRAYVREFAPDYKPDWGDYTEQKWYINFDGVANKWSYSNNQFMRTVATVYMPKEVAVELVRKLNLGEVVL